MTQTNNPSKSSQDSQNYQNSEGIIDNAQNLLNQLSLIREFNSNNPSQDTSNIPTLDATTSGLNNIIAYCQSNSDLVTRILQGTRGTTVSGTA
jgi:hypothetical protein